MVGQELTRELIWAWAYQGADIDMYDSGEDGDAAVFDGAVNNFFDWDEFLLFSADPECLARSYFAGKLARALVKLIASAPDFSFGFPSVCGISSEEDFLEKTMDRNREVYKLLAVVNKMRSMKDPAIRSLYRQVFYFRNDSYDASREFSIKCARKLDLGLFNYGGT
ncbi:hypothetical protein [Pseudomonas sp. PS01303]|jgi:hypothetical protein|uniref:hypothetical protein n=1 Tax=Pseudomonas sp. PS01303 TaxID=2991439 RepID=UPI00249C8641|nr:hypothetical protein [Pseudomonas sp. PS01303]